MIFVRLNYEVNVKSDTFLIFKLEIGLQSEKTSFRLVSSLKVYLGMIKILTLLKITLLQ